MLKQTIIYHFSINFVKINIAQPMKLKKNKERNKKKKKKTQLILVNQSHSPLYPILLSKVQK